MNVLEVYSLSKSFGGVRAVHDCNFSVAEKRITALIGPNGAGKTTVFNLVNGFMTPEAGRILFLGTEVTRYPVWKRSRFGMSRTFQLSRLFANLSIYENLILAVRQDDDLFWRMWLKRKGDEREEGQIRAILEFVGLNKDPAWPVTELSYGEQKLFDLARALLNPHTLLLLDEPVAGVNPVLRENLKKIFIALKGRGESTLLIEHDIDFVRSVADWIIVMDQGTVLTEGEPEKVVRDKRVLEAYLGG